MEMNIGNMTTIATLIAGPILSFIGTDIMTKDQLTSIITAILVLIWLLINSSNPNSLEALGNGTEDTADNQPKVLNDEYDC